MQWLGTVISFTEPLHENTDTKHWYTGLKGCTSCWPTLSVVDLNIQVTQRPTKIGCFENLLLTEGALGNISRLLHLISLPLAQIRCLHFVNEMSSAPCSASSCLFAWGFAHIFSCQKSSETCISSECNSVRISLEEQGYSSVNKAGITLPLDADTS